MNYKIAGAVLGAIAGAIGIGVSVRKHYKSPLVCSQMMEDIGRKIFEDYKQKHDGEMPSKEEFSKLFAGEIAKLKK